MIVAQPQHHCVVYRKSDGRILHRHLITVLPGADPVEKDEAEARALRIVKSKGYSEQDLGVLHVGFTSMSHNEKYKVDVQKQELVSEGKTDEGRMLEARLKRRRSREGAGLSASTHHGPKKDEPNASNS